MTARCRLSANRQDAINQLAHLRAAKKEHLVILYLNARQQLLARETVSIGTLTESRVHPREVFEPALKHLAASIILTHNHPSGDANPSPADKQITQRLLAAGKIMGIELIDHIIISDSQYFSFKEKGLI